VRLDPTWMPAIFSMSSHPRRDRSLAVGYPASHGDFETVRKAVLPAGIRDQVLAHNQGCPEGIAPIVDVPAIQINVEECVASGIRDLILITSRARTP